VREPSAFQWQSQLKQRYRAGEATVHVANAEFKYGFEYLGNAPRLVVTPLTDRFYVTATQALLLRLGCAPAGPAGTGKTETTKDLASVLGKACYVFNCSPELDYKSIGCIFKGLGASGAWGCFDEFNRLVRPAKHALHPMCGLFCLVCLPCRLLRFCPSARFRSKQCLTGALAALSARCHAV
jgi:dynein heavy chain